MADNRLLVPVSDSPTLRQTVEYAVGTALEESGSGYIQFIYVHAPDQTVTDSDLVDSSRDPVAVAEELLDKVTVWANEDAGEADLTIEVEQIGMDEYLFSPEDFGDRLSEQATDHSIDRVVLDPEYDPGIGSPLLRPLVYELTRLPGLDVEEAPVTARTRRRPLVVRSTPLRVGSLFFLSFLFYQLLAGQFYWFDLVTGGISATIVAVGLSRVAFRRDPTTQSVLRLARTLVYIPYLLFEIVKANVLVAMVILHPRLPIEPRMTRVQAAVWGALPMATLANSITLTPGTLSVRVRGRTITVHTLVVPAREDLFDGGLERGVRFVFYGRNAMQISSPRERGDTEILQPPAEDENEDSGGEGE